MPATSIYSLRFQSLFDAPHGPFLGQDLAEDVEAELARIDADVADIDIVRLGPNSKAMNNNIVSGTTTSGSYVDMPATSSFSFTKIHASTSIALTMDVSLLSTAASTIARFGVRINSVDYDITEVTFNVSNTHLRGSGTRDVAAALAAGAYTIQGRWLRTTGAGTLTISNDWFSMRATEINPA